MGLPLERAILAAYAELVGPAGPVADLGCGPGGLTAYLRRLGVEAYGIDLSPRMEAPSTFAGCVPRMSPRCSTGLASRFVPSSTASLDPTWTSRHRTSSSRRSHRPRRDGQRDGHPRNRSRSAGANSGCASAKPASSSRAPGRRQSTSILSAVGRRSTSAPARLTTAAPAISSRPLLDRRAVPAHLAERHGRPRRPGQYDHLVATTRQVRSEPPPEGARTSGQYDSHLAPSRRGRRTSPRVRRTAER